MSGGAIICYRKCWACIFGGCHKDTPIAKVPFGPKTGRLGRQARPCDGNASDRGDGHDADPFFVPCGCSCWRVQAIKRRRARRALRARRRRA